jgi:hypothetical protein
MDCDFNATKYKNCQAALAFVKLNFGVSQTKQSSIAVKMLYNLPRIKILILIIKINYICHHSKRNCIILPA